MSEQQQVVSIVYHNTTPAQAPMMDTTAIKTIAGYKGIRGDTVESVLDSAVERGDLIESNGRYVTTDDERVQRAISHVVQQVPVDQSLLGELNRAKMDS